MERLEETRKIAASVSKAPKKLQSSVAEKKH